jgi:hypothetical protein
MEAYRGVGVELHSFLNSVLDAMVNFSLPRGRTLLLVEQQTGCTRDDLEKRKSLLPLPVFELQTVQAVAWSLTLRTALS